MPTFGKDDPKIGFITDIAKAAMRHASIPYNLEFDSEWKKHPTFTVDRSRLNSERHTLKYLIDVRLENGDKVWVTVKVRKNPDFPKKGSEWLPVTCTFISKRHKNDRRKFMCSTEEGKIIMTPKW